MDTDQILFVLREYYGLEGAEQEVIEIRKCVRPYLLLIIKAYLTKVGMVDNCPYHRVL